MLAWLIEVYRAIRGVRLKAQDALSLLRKEQAEAFDQTVKYLRSDLERLVRLLRDRVSGEHLSNLRRHAHFAEEHDFVDILERDIPGLEEKIETYALMQRERELEREARETPKAGFEELLHPVIKDDGYPQYIDGHLRDAVLNAFIAVFDQIRARTGLDLDGSNLVGRTFSEQNPYLILSDLETESGRNDQVGFLRIYQGAYQGIRNPKAHTLQHDLDQHKAAQYLVFASLLARRVDESHLVRAARNTEADTSPNSWDVG